MVRAANNYNKVISTTLEVWVVVGTHRRGLQSFWGWSRIRKFRMPCGRPKKIPTSLIHSTNNCGICYVPGAGLGAGDKEMSIIDADLPLEELRV